MQEQHSEANYTQEGNLDPMNQLCYFQFQLILEALQKVLHTLPKECMVARKRKALAIKLVKSAAPPTEPKDS